VSVGDPGAASRSAPVPGGQEALGQLLEAIIALLAGILEDPLDMGSKGTLPPPEPGGGFGAMRVSLVGAFEKSPGSGPRIGGILARRKLVAFRDLVAVLPDKSA
jgi:hypothetical protein